MKYYQLLVEFSVCSGEINVTTENENMTIGGYYQTFGIVAEDEDTAVRLMRQARHLGRIVNITCERVVEGHEYGDQTGIVFGGAKFLF